MLKTRVMPCLLLDGKRLVKTVKFKEANYVGDPVNAVKIYNEKEVDELIFLDINATRKANEPPYNVISDIATECFMPFTYGGGISSIDQMEKIFGIGVEKIAINSRAVEDRSIITKAAELFGSQSVVVSIDVKKTWTGKYKVCTIGGTKITGTDPTSWARELESLGAGEILLTSIDRDGTYDGYDLALIKIVSSAVNIPVIACGGAGKLDDFRLAVDSGASAVAAGSKVVYHGTARGVLINFPSQDELESLFGRNKA
jgi:imidazole glycerol-phosphate synthase subunit HisF